MDRSEYKSRYSSTIKHIDSFITYAMKQPSVADWYADYVMSDDVMIPKGVVVACDDVTFNSLVRQSKRYDPELIISQMSKEKYIMHNERGANCIAL